MIANAARHAGGEVAAHERLGRVPVAPAGGAHDARLVTRVTTIDGYRGGCEDPAHALPISTAEPLDRGGT